MNTLAVISSGDAIGLLSVALVVSIVLNFHAVRVKLAAEEALFEAKVKAIFSKAKAEEAKAVTSVVGVESALKAEAEKVASAAESVLPKA